MGRADVTPGSKVGTYVVQGQLGATPWADTFVAAGPGDKTFALKVFDASDDGALSALAEAKKKLESVPGHLVLPIAEIGHDAEAGVRFIATPLSDHPSLADLVAIYALSPSEAIALVKNIGIALDNAHVAGLVHLALKPSNVFVGPPPTYGVRIVDFGADALRLAKKERGDVTWLAPEQIDSNEPGDARSDVYAAALLTFFAMTGKPRRTEAASDVPRRLDSVLLRALGPHDDRFESVRAFAEALESAVAMPSASTPPPPPVEEARSSERHIKATLKLEKFRMPTLENSAPSGMQPLPQKTQKLPPARIPPPPPSPSPPSPAPSSRVTPADLVPPTDTPIEPMVPAPVAMSPPNPIATPIEPVAVRPRRTVYIPHRVLIALVVAVTLLTLGVTIAAVRKIRSDATPTASSAPTVASAIETPLPPTSIVVPPPPKPDDEPATDVDVLGPNEAELEVVCTPACEKVIVDGKIATQYPAPLRMTPGRHGIGVGKTGYGGQYKLVFLKPSERQTVSFTLGPTKK